jgi:type IV secretory pathway ATPase VirB11/archaellum biosynthesis ATPase
MGASEGPAGAFRYNRPGRLDRIAVRLAPISSSFVEERVPVDAKKLPFGDRRISAAALARGE